VESDRVSPTVASLERLVEAAGEHLRLESVRGTLLEPDNPEWQRIESEKRSVLRPSPEVSVAELLRRGVALSRQAVRLRNAVEIGESSGSPRA
jgi:hypothetical protein